jgi:hypothetical protein
MTPAAITLASLQQALLIVSSKDAVAEIIAKLQ